MVVRTNPKFMFFSGKKYRHYNNYKSKAEAKQNAARVRKQTGMKARVHNHAVYVR